MGRMLPRQKSPEMLLKSLIMMFLMFLEILTIRADRFTVDNQLLVVILCFPANWLDSLMAPAARAEGLHTAPAGPARPDG